MAISRLLFLVVGIFISMNVFASAAPNNNYSRMCVSAYLVKPIHVGDITFYVKNEPIGNISIHGAWLDIITIIDDGYFKDQKDFEEKKGFLSIEDSGKKLNVIKFTYQYC